MPPDPPPEGILTPLTLAVDAADPAERVRRAFAARFGAEATHVARAPGRVNLIGDHTDYNDGFVLPMPIDRAVWIALRRRPDRLAHLVSLNFGEEVRYPLDARPDVPRSSWASYVTGVVEELREGHGLDAGFEAVVFGDVPVGSGLSSSAALEIATAVGLDALLELRLEPVETARLCQRVEHRYVGVQCGIMDQFASRLGRRGHALFLDCRTLEVEHVPLTFGDAVVLVVDSKAPRALADSKYNERRAECAVGVAHFRHSDPTVRALRDVSEQTFEAHAEALPEAVQRRCRHVVTENCRVLQAVAALRIGRLDAFGGLMSASHASLRDDYAVSSPPLDLLVDTALTTGSARATTTSAAWRPT